MVIHTWSPPDRPPDPWAHRGPWEASIGAGGITLDAGRRNTMGYFSFGGGYRFTDRLSARLEWDVAPDKIAGLGFQCDDPSTGGNWEVYGIGGTGTIRADVVRAWPVSIYADAGLGGFHTRRTFPVDGARDNWMKAAGLGVEFRFSNNGFVSIGARYARVSPRVFETGSSAAFNGAQYYVNVSFTW